jgi:glycosyltransferase involved in cell wall biosynthesis
MQPPGLEFPLYERQTYHLGYTWFVLRQLYGLMQQTAFDVIDFPDYGAEGFAYQMDRSLWSWVPVVVQLHGPLALFVEQMGWPANGSRFQQAGMFMEGFSIQRADALMACSANIAELTSRHYGAPRDAIDVVHCGVDAQLFQPPLEGEWCGDRPTVLFVGNIVENKGVCTVVEAVLQLRRKYPNIRLQLVGVGATELVVLLQDRIRAAGASEQVEFAGFVRGAALASYYRRASVFCSPAEYEGGVANVYLEAMACGCPVVASTAGGAPEAVTDGETGFLVPPNNVAATVTALDRVLADTALRQRLSVAARRRVEDYFAMDSYIRRVLAVYQKAIQRARHKLHQLQVANKCVPEGQEQ